jgi:oligoendopeptidase F
VSKIKTKWNFKLLYGSDDSTEIEKDFKKGERAVISFRDKYKNNKKYLNDADELFLACKDYEKLIESTELTKPYCYFILRRDVNQNDKKLNAKVNEYQEKLDKTSNELLFFTLNVGKIDKEKQKEFLKNKKLSKYHYFLNKIFENAKYCLTEEEEKVISLFSTPANGMWIDGVNKVLSKQEVNFQNRTMPISEAMGLLSNLETKKRRKLNHLINQKFIEVSDFSEAEINAIYTTKKISDDLRGFKTPYQSTIKSYENEEKVIENLVKTVTDNFKVAHRFYKIKAKILKEKRLEYADRSASVGVIHKDFSFEETIKIVRNGYERFGSEYEKIFEDYLLNGQIDVYPKKSKKGGAFCFGVYGLPTFILLNQVDNYQSVLTLGHEMGHAIHTKFSHTQPSIYSDYTMSVAETASTLFENFVFDEIYESLSEKEKIIALHNNINDNISTIFRQIACFNFEEELHETIRKNGYCAKEDIAKIMNKHMKSYLGPMFDLKEEDGYFFVDWLHIRRFFYVYSYAYGCLISNFMYQEYKKDKKFKDKIEQFLRAGGSNAPEDIFSGIGINIRDPKFFKEGIKSIEEKIKKLEKLVK